MPTKLPPQQREKIQVALRGAFSTEASLSEFAMVDLGLNLEDLDGANLRAKVTSLVTWALDEGQLPKLLEKARDWRPDNVEVRAVVGNALAYLASIAPWYDPPDPYDACFVRKRMAFLNRTSLRANLRELAQDEGAKTLVVTGATQSGRSYSLQLIVFLSQRLGGYQTAFVDLQQAGQDVDPRELLQNIALQMEHSPNVEAIPTRQHEQPARWNTALCNWLIGETRGRDALWIVIDGVDQVALREDTRDLLERLVRTAENQAPWLRVILLAYSQPLPSDLKSQAYYDEIEAIDREVIEEFFSELAAHKGIASDEMAITAIVDAILTAVPDDTNDRLRKLSAAVANAAEKLAPAAAAGGP